jgi:hypothetical protein
MFKLPCTTVDTYYLLAIMLNYIACVCASQGLICNVLLVRSVSNVFHIFVVRTISIILFLEDFFAPNIYNSANQPAPNAAICFLLPSRRHAS